MESWGCVWFVDTEGRMPRQEELINFEVHSHDFFFFHIWELLRFPDKLSPGLSLRPHSWTYSRGPLHSLRALLSRVLNRSPSHPSRPDAPHEPQPRCCCASTGYLTSAKVTVLVFVVSGDQSHGCYLICSAHKLIGTQWSVLTGPGSSGKVPKGQ